MNTQAENTQQPEVKQPMIIVPTIGRVVHFHPPEQHDQPFPAVVCYVHSDRLINVGGFNEYGSPFSFTSLKLIQEGDPPPYPGEAYATWMPYQVKAAAKYPV